jgi:hypothetical protein
LLDSKELALQAIPKKTTNTWILIEAGCVPSTVNPVYCTNHEPADNTENPEVCPEGYGQTSYNTCCILGQLDCVNVSDSSMA